MTNSETEFSIEELVAMMISKAREMAVNSANQPINEVVITVPGYFNQAERKAIIQSAELAGLKVLQLINDYTAGMELMSTDFFLIVYRVHNPVSCFN